MLTVVAAFVGIALGAVGLWVWLRTVEHVAVAARRGPAPLAARHAEREAETTRREAQIEAREQVVALRAEIEAETGQQASDRQGGGACAPA